MKLSIIITAWKEEKTIRKCLNTLLKTIPQELDYELILACPDQETLTAAKDEIKNLNLGNRFVHLQDPGKGKPTAINMALDKAQGEIILLGDGDTYFGENVVTRMLKHFENPEIMGVTGRPKSCDEKDNMLNYFGHLLSDAAHHKRTVDLTTEPHGKSLTFVKKRKFFTMSGYLFAMRKNDIRTPTDCLVEDAYFSYELFNKGGKIEYEPEAIVYVKYPKNLSDYFKQKKRSVGGFIQLWEYGIVKPETKTRSFWRELEYFWFPFAYAKNIREFFWSLMLYPIRFWLWVQIYWERKIKKKDFVKTWVRIESTK
jgi:biofilm PGA synthesis N-glycosyltransferase PgaC